MNIVVHNPQPVVIRDIDGLQQGANHWDGLRDVMADQLDGFWEKVSWHRHSCNLCRKTIIVNGQARSIKAGVLDGITATRGPSCAVWECPLDLVNLGGARSVPRV